MLRGKKIVVAGAASGIGAVTAKQLAAAGSLVVAGDINTSGAEETVSQIHAAGGEAVAAAFDLADRALYSAFCQRSCGCLRWN
jgi:NAD(P)-dependent dehydrogenase (short-subunit alcohol dehydrogenase family)